MRAVGFGPLSASNDARAHSCARALASVPGPTCVHEAILRKTEMDLNESDSDSAEALFLATDLSITTAVRSRSKGKKRRIVVPDSDSDSEPPRGDADADSAEATDSNTDDEGSDADSMSDFVCSDREVEYDSTASNEQQEDAFDFGKKRRHKKRKEALTEHELLAKQLRERREEGCTEEGCGLTEIIRRIRYEKYRPLDENARTFIRNRIGISGTLDGMAELRKLLAGQRVDELLLARNVYLISIDRKNDQRYVEHLMPLLMATTCVDVVAEVGEDGQFYTDPWMTGFTDAVSEFSVSFPYFGYGIGCFCRQKHLKHLYSVCHQKSKLRFMVGSTCIGKFNREVPKLFYTDAPEQDSDHMPEWFSDIYKFNNRGELVTAWSNKRTGPRVPRRGARRGRCENLL